MKIRTSLALLALSLTFPSRGTGQCSDAGVCSIGGMEETAHLLTFTSGISYGVSSDDEYTFTDIQIGLQALPFEDLFLSLSAPYRMMSGPLGSTSGIGDLLLAGRYTVWSSHELSVSLEGGVRLATGAVNEGGLPQAYQPGLGTTDVLFGVSVSGDRWTTSAGYQHAPGRSANTVNQLRRGNDVSVRAAYTLLQEELVLRAEVILIHKLERSDGFRPQPPQSSLYLPPGPIPDTDRSQVNIGADASYPLESGITLSLRGAMALLARPVNLDGLKRNLTIHAGLAFPVL